MASSVRTDPTSVFADASVLFAAAYSTRGFARDLVLAGVRDEIILWVSAFVLDEADRNLAKTAPSALPAFGLLRQTLTTRSSRPSKALVLRVARTVELKDAAVVAGGDRGPCPLSGDVRSPSSAQSSRQD
jgi:hypothetical protein